MATMDAEPRKQYVAWLDPETDVLYAMLPQDELTQLRRVADAAKRLRAAQRAKDTPEAILDRLYTAPELDAALAALPKEDE